MGLITEEVETHISFKNVGYYTKLGYIIPESWKDGNCKIMVRSKDLPKHSRIKIKRQCDDCGEIKEVTYASYTSTERNGKCYCHNCASKQLSGDKSHRWNPNKTQEERVSYRGLDGYVDFIKKVLARDNYTCQCCKKEKSELDCELNVHHLNAYNWFVDGRTDPKNAITLCENCHGNFHSLYGKGNNTKEQYEEWIGTTLSILETYDIAILKARQVYCVENNIIYENAIDAAKSLGISFSRIYNVCNQKTIEKKYINKYGEQCIHLSRCLTANNKHFLWYDEYLKMSSEEIDSILNNKNSRSRNVICLTTGKIFQSINDASNFYNCSRHIADCCKGKRQSCGELPDGTRLQWMYYEYYLLNQDV